MTQSLNGSIETISHQADRLTIQIDDSFDGFFSTVPRLHVADASGRGDGTPSPGPTIGGRVTADRASRGRQWKASASPARCSIRCPSGSTQRCCPK
jgi:hypothetical protein